MITSLSSICFGVINRSSGVAQRFSQKNKFDKVLLFDRDNTLINDNGYTFRISDFEIISRNIPYLIKLQEQGWAFFIISNQSAVARNKCTIEEVLKFNTFLIEQFRTLGIEFIEVVFCPHLRFCYCRKPKPGMIEYLIKEHSLKREAIYMLGDKQSDVKAAEKSSIQGFLLTEASYKKIFSTILDSDHDHI
jgi:D-glycero-D-manno-heptose 1,7-bisphosphate phosphatase